MHTDKMYTKALRHYDNAVFIYNNITLIASQNIVIAIMIYHGTCWVYDLIVQWGPYDIIDIFPL